MELLDIILLINTSGTLAVGTICFFIVYTTFRGIEDDDKLEQFSKRFMMSVAVLLLFVSYIMMYFTFLEGHPLAIYPFFLLLIGVFLYLMRSAASFDELANTYGLSQEEKLERMEEEELGR